jgi:phage gp45-like
MYIYEGKITNITKNQKGSEVFSYYCQIQVYEGLAYNDVLLINTYNANSHPKIGTKALVFACGANQKIAIPINTSYKPVKINEGDYVSGNVEVKNYIKYTQDTIEIGADNTKHIILKAGGINILSNISEQFGKVIEALNAISNPTAVPPASPNPQPLTTASQISSASSAISDLKSQLDGVI